MEVRFWAKTDTGRSRDHNEDNFLVDRSLSVFMVCDGMGGHAAGEVASEAAARTIRSYLDERREQLPGERALREESARRGVCDLLAAAVREANSRVWTMAEENPHQRGMGTTCSLMMVRGNWGFYAHVGDSRVYRIRPGGVSQVTDDHSLRERMIRQGKLGEDEPFDQKDAITRAVGVAESVEVDTQAFELRAGDRFLLCSDGLSEYIDGNAHLGEVAGASDLRDVADDAIDHANASGGKDNVTVVVLETHEGSGVLDAREATTVGRAVRSVPFFEPLTTDEFGQILERVDVRELGRGESVTGVGESHRALCVVCSGRVRLTRGGRTVEQLGPGDYYGTRRLFVVPDEEIRARAVEDARVAVISRETFTGMVSERPDTGLKILWGLAGEFGRVVSHLPWEEFRHPDLLDSLDHGDSEDLGAGSGAIEGQGAGAEGEGEYDRPPPIPDAQGETPAGPPQSLDETVVGGETADRDEDSGDVEAGQSVVSGEASTTAGSDDEEPPARRQRHDTQNLRETANFKGAPGRDVDDTQDISEPNQQEEDATRKTIEINLEDDDNS